MSATYVKINNKYIKLNSKGLPRKRKLTEEDIGTKFKTNEGIEYILKLNKKNKNKLVWKHVKVNRKNKIRVRMSKEESNQRALDKMSQELSQLLENVTEKREKEKLGRELVKFY